MVGGVDIQSPEFRRELDDLTDLYYESPDPFDGVVETLELFFDVGLDIGLVTHASEDWTNKKRKEGGFMGKFKMVHCIDTLGTKDKYEWWEAAHKIEVPPQQLIIVGDSWKSDIQPAEEMGVPLDQIFRVKTDYGLANKGRVLGVREIENFNDLPFAVIYNLSK